jgi:hypothetical protein
MWKSSVLYRVVNFRIIVAVMEFFKIPTASNETLDIKLVLYDYVVLDRHTHNTFTGITILL